MTLKLNGLEVDCVIGDLPDERNRLQRIVVDVEMEVADKAAETDSIDDAVDYAELSGRIRAALVAARCRLIERAAKVVYGVLPTRSARVSVTKPGAVPGLASATAVYP